MDVARKFPTLGNLDGLTIAAKTEADHGDWFPWLEREFGWTVRTADKYMQVARAFKLESGSNFTGLTIDATALYALSAPEVPQELRDGCATNREDGMSKKRPNQAEARWRANYRYRRQLASWLEEDAIGDPLGLNALLRQRGFPEAIEFAIIQTDAPRYDAAWRLRYE